MRNKEKVMDWAENKYRWIIMDKEKGKAVARLRVAKERWRCRGKNGGDRKKGGEKGRWNDREEEWVSKN